MIVKSHNGKYSVTIIINSDNYLQVIDDYETDALDFVDCSTIVMRSVKLDAPDKVSFRDMVAGWVSEHGFEPVWSHNHPSDEKDELHFTLEGSRLIVTKNKGEEYCHFHKDLLEGKDDVYSVKSSKRTLYEDKVFEDFDKFVIKVNKIKLWD